MKIKVHPLFFITIFLMLAFEQATAVMAYIFAIIVHEMAHSKVAKCRGYQMGVITLMPFGGVIESGKQGSNKTDTVIIALAGPFLNFIIATVCVAMWWIYPVLYNYSLNLCIANFSLGVINMLPFYPLDGSRIIFTSAKNKLKCIKALKICTLIFGIALFVLGICVIVLYRLNFTVAIFGIFLIYSAFQKSEQDSYTHVANSFAFNKNFEQGVRKIIYYVDKKSQLFRLVKRLNSDELCEFVVCDGQKKILTLQETDLEQLCLNNKLTDKLEKILKV